MLQRRFDNPQRKRPVMRTVENQKPSLQPTFTSFGGPSTILSTLSATQASALPAASQDFSAAKWLKSHVADTKWRDLLEGEFNKPYPHLLFEQYKAQTIYPAEHHIFNALNLCPFEEVRVVLLGQDPYHGPGQAHGLCFSVQDGIPFPPSLKNIFREIQSDVGGAEPSTGNLERWAKQGVLMLNSLLTVRDHTPMSHANKGWEQFTNKVIELVANTKSNVVFILWGGYAQKMAAQVNRSKHEVLEGAHPSPLSATRYFGCKHFSKCNSYLGSFGQPQIDWAWNATKTTPTKKKKEAKKDFWSVAVEASPKVERKVAKPFVKPTNGDWEQRGSLLVLDMMSEGHKKIVGFDMDDTLIATKSGKTFAESRTDWQWIYDGIPAKLKQLNDQNVKIVIFTNQAGIGGKTGQFDMYKKNSITGKIEDLIEILGFPVQAFIATTDDVYRKPSTQMWDTLVSSYNKGVQPDLSQCMFVGDAAGRFAKGARKKDFSNSDRKFAMNIGIAFKTPEEYFLNEAAEPFEDIFDPAASLQKEICGGGVESLTSDKQEMVLFVGFPASGKSTLAKTYMVPKGYVHVNRDTLKTQEKCLKAAETAVASGKSVVIDNTNPDAAVRATYIKIAKKAKINVRCFRFMVNEEMANHLNYFRERITNGASPRVPKIGYHMYKSKLVQPTLSEGFSEIKQIHFVPNFSTPEHEEQFNARV